MRNRRRFSLLLVLSVCARAEAQAPRVDLPRVLAELEPEIRSRMTDGKIPSLTVALVAGDSIVWTGAYGYANLRTRTAATVETVYLIGSTFKAMSTVALLQQMERGKFRLDDPVSGYLTRVKLQGEDTARPVTFRHLLTHTSGLPGAFGPFPLWHDSAPPPILDYLRRDLRVVSPPLDSVRYSNLAFTLVAHLVEVFTGEDYKTVIRREVWGPLEMISTEFNPRPDMDERLAVPYDADARSEPRPAVRLRAAVWPAGIVYGTIRDQANWLIANLNGGVFKGIRLLSKETVREMQRRQYDRFTGPLAGNWGNDSSGYGLTWWTMTRDGERYIAHSGSVPGYTALVHGNVDRLVGIVLLTNGNRAHPHLVRIANRATELLVASRD